MGRTLKQILQTEKPAVIADAKARAEAILDQLEPPGGSTTEPSESSLGNATKSGLRDEDSSST